MAKQKPPQEKPEVDPAVEELYGRTLRMEVNDIFNNTYLSKSTIYKARHPNPMKRTRRPQFLTLKGIASACGLEYRLVRKGRSK